MTIETYIFCMVTVVSLSVRGFREAVLVGIALESSQIRYDFI